MKKTIAFLLMLTYLGSFAQEPQTAEEFVSAANESYKAKDFATAYDLFTKAIDLNDAAGVVDTIIFYNAGYCAYKSKKYDKAPELLKRSIQLDYKTELSYVIATNSYRKSNDNENFAKMVVEAYEKYPKNKNLITLMSSYQFKEGLAYYNKASEIVQKADQIRETDPDEFNKLMGQAKEAYNAALPYLLKTNEIKPDTKNLPEALSGIYEALGNSAEAQKWKAKSGK